MFEEVEPRGAAKRRTFALLGRGGKQKCSPVLDNEGQVQDAYLAATAEELARAHKLATPRWTAAESRKLHRPWFASPLSAVRAVLLLESPAAFRSRNLFISENALTRA